MPFRLTETIPLSEAGTSTSKAGHMLVRAISAGVGSSGYYSPEVIEQAGKDQLIGAGTPLFLDHPTDVEAADRPERSVRDIAAVFTEAAAYDADSQSLVGEIKVMAPYRDLLNDLAPHIGLSIRGSATDVVEGEHDGRRVRVIEGLATIDSVDFVTRAGRGGEVIEILESANVIRRAVEHGLEEATANDLRDALSATLRDAYGGDKTYVWVRDFDTSTVWFEIESESDNGIYAQGYAGDGTTLTGDRTEVRIQTSYVPITTTEASRLPAGRSTTPTEESKEDTMGNITIEESEHTRLVEEAGRVTVLEGERDTAIRERDTARAELVARRIIGEQKGVIFSELEIRGLVASMPLKEGALDETAFRATVEAEVKAAQDLHAQVQEAGGVGRVSGFGSTTGATPTGEVSESDLDKAIARGFGYAVKEA